MKIKTIMLGGAAFAMSATAALAEDMTIVSWGVLTRLLNKLHTMTLTLQKLV